MRMRLSLGIFVDGIFQEQTIRRYFNNIIKIKCLIKTANSLTNEVMAPLRHLLYLVTDSNYLTKHEL